MLEKPELFDSKKSFRVTVLALILVILLRLVFEYFSYKEFIEKPFYFTNATVLNAYEKTKNSKTYMVLKLQAEEGFTFYTTSHKKEDFQDAILRLQIFPNDTIGFDDYLGTFYVKSRIKSIKKIPSTFKNTLMHTISGQHKESALAGFYNAIFFATPIDKALREKIALLGVSHLVALSGFHLGILWGLLYGLFLLIYRPYQQKYFPYRHALLDVGFVTVILLGVYLWFVDFPPSLVRSYAMVLVGWAVIVLGVELLSFKFLAAIGLVLLALFPFLLVSLSFWLSMAGVFYIFLLLQYGKTYSKWLITLLLIPVGIFLLMLPIVHMIFPVTSVYQLLSPLLSIVFIPFYPFVMLLHLLGMGGVLDSALLWLFSLPKESVEHLLPWWVTGSYVGLSIYSIFDKRAFYILLATAMMYAMYIFIM